jgi:hypothetical protein
MSEDPKPRLPKTDLTDAEAEELARTLSRPGNHPANSKVHVESALRRAREARAQGQGISRTA